MLRPGDACRLRRVMGDGEHLWNAEGNRVVGHIGPTETALVLATDARWCESASCGHLVMVSSGALGWTWGSWLCDITMTIFRLP